LNGWSYPGLWFGVGSCNPTLAVTMTAFTLCLRFASMD
jgi:hypothetical protein